MTNDQSINQIEKEIEVELEKKGLSLKQQPKIFNWKNKKNIKKLRLTLDKLTGLTYEKEKLVHIKGKEEIKNG